MKWKSILIIILIIFGILFLTGIISNYFLTSQLKKIGLTPQHISPIQIWPKILLNPEEISKPENLQKVLEQFLKLREVTKKEFISPDGKLKVEYTSEWIEIKPEDFEKFVSRDELKEKYHLKTLFSGEKFGFGNISILIVQEILVPKGKFLREILAEMEESNRKAGIKMEILNLKEGQMEIIFEGKYENKYSTHSLEKMILLEGKENNKIFLIAYLSLERDWGKLKEEGGKIISSAQLLE